MSSNTPFFLRKIRNAWKNLTLPISQCEGEIPISSSPSSVTRVRSLAFVLPQNHDSEHLPLYLNAIEIEKQDYLPRSPFTIPTKIVSLTFQAALGYQAMSTSHYQPSILGASMVIAFAASFSALFIKYSYPRLAAIVEKIGYLSFALSFFLMSQVFFSGTLIMWIIIGGLALAILASLFM